MATSVTKKPTVHTDTVTGLQYLCGAKQVLFETGVVLSRLTFDKYINGTDKTMLNELLESASQEVLNRNFDFAYAKTTGKLRRKRGSAVCKVSIKKEDKKPPVKELEAITATQEQQPASLPQPEVLQDWNPADKTFSISIHDEEEVKPEEQKKALNLPGVLSSVPLVTVIMIVVGIGSAIMSAYHTTLFLYQGGKPFWIAVLTGVLFILFSATAFTATRHFFYEKVRWVGVIFAFAGAVVVLFSVFSTLTVNFNHFKWVDDGKILAVVEDNEALLAHERLLADNRQALEEINARILLLEGEADYWRAMSWRRYDEFQEILNIAQERRIMLRQRQIELESMRPEIVALAENSRETIFSLIERLLGIREDAARFFVYAAPACLYDILAPFALSVVLLLVDRRKGKCLKSEKT